jgi:hypothetical protein
MFSNKKRDGLKETAMRDEYMGNPPKFVARQSEHIE